MALQAALALALGVGGYSEGYAVRYNVGVMARVAAVRGIAPQPCMVAWTQATAHDIGETWLEVQGPHGRRKCLVVDLPQPRDKPGLVRRGIIVELDYASGLAVCGARWSGRARDCKVRVRKVQ